MSDTPPTETSRSPRGRLPAGLWIVLAVALVWRLILFFEIQGAPLAFWHLWDQSDMHSFWRQARMIEAGDWLARATYYPYHLWMEVAPPEAWRAWQRPSAFYQPPFYSYFLAFMMRVSRDPATAARLVQLALGVLSCGLIYSLTRRLFGAAAALAAGLMAAVYGPMLMVESQFLRETWIVLFVSLALWAYARWRGATAAGRDRSRERRRVLGFSLVLGAILGVMGMLHEAAALLALALGIFGFHRLRPRDRRGALLWLIGLTAGMALGGLPLMARNMAVGLPPLTRCTGSALAWAVANHADAPYGGVLWVSPPPDFAEIIRRTGGSPAALVAATFETYHGQWWRWLGHWTERALALAAGPENNENLCYDYFRLRLPILAFCLDFRWLFPLAVGGACAWGRRRWSWALRRGALPAVMLLFALLAAALISAVLPLGRYRLMFFPCMAPFAGWMAATLWSDARDGRLRRLGRLAALVVALALFQFGLGRLWPIGGLRPADFVVASSMQLRGGNEPLAAAELEDAVEQGAYNADVAYSLAWLRATADDPAVRKPKEALRIAQGPLAASSWKPAERLDVMAAADADLGRFDRAAQLAQSALDDARATRDEALADAIARRLELYRQGRPYRLSMAQSEANRQGSRD